MARTRDVVIAVAGAAVILSAAVGLLEIDQRAGPYRVTLAPVALPVVTDGSFTTQETSGTTGPGGVCIPEAPGTTCRAARTDIDFTVRGIPPLPDGMHYLALLTGEHARPLGTLAAEGPDHRMRATFDETLAGAQEIVVILTPQPDGQDDMPTLLSVAFEVGATDQAPLTHETDARAADGEGDARFNEIGGFTVSTTAVAALADAPPSGLWAYHAWFQPRDAAAPWTYLGIFETDNDDARLDARVEQVRLEDQARLVAYLAPADAPTATPAGFPAYTAELPEH